MSPPLLLYTSGLRTPEPSSSQQWHWLAGVGGGDMMDVSVVVHHSLSTLTHNQTQPQRCAPTCSGLSSSFFSRSISFFLVSSLSSRSLKLSGFWSQFFRQLKWHLSTCFSYILVTVELSQVKLNSLKICLNFPWQVELSQHKLNFPNTSWTFPTQV